MQLGPRNTCFRHIEVQQRARVGLADQEHRGMERKHKFTTGLQLKLCAIMAVVWRNGTFLHVFHHMHYFRHQYHQIVHTRLIHGSLMIKNEVGMLFSGSSQAYFMWGGRIGS